MSDPSPRGSDYADAVRGVLERAAQVEQAQGQVVEAKEPSLTRPPVVAAITLVFLAVVGYNVKSLRRPPPRLPPERAETTAQVTTMIAAQIIDAHTREHGGPPASLSEVGLDPDQFEYRVMPDGSYELVSRVDGAQVRYDSREGPAALLRELGAPLPAPPDGGSHR